MSSAGEEFEKWWGEQDSGAYMFEGVRKRYAWLAWKEVVRRSDTRIASLEAQLAEKNRQIGLLVGLLRSPHEGPHPGNGARFVVTCKGEEEG